MPQNWNQLSEGLPKSFTPSRAIKHHPVVNELIIRICRAEVHRLLTKNDLVMEVRTNDITQVILTVPVMSAEYLPITRILRLLQRDVSQCPRVQVNKSVWTSKRLRKNVGSIAKSFEVLGRLFVDIPLPEWQDWAQLPAWSSEVIWSDLVQDLSIPLNLECRPWMSKQESGTH